MMRVNDVTPGARHRRWVLGAVAGFAALAAGSAGAAVTNHAVSRATRPARTTGDLLPTLVADPPERAFLESGPGFERIRFDGFVHNTGPGPIEVRGRRANASSPMTVVQRIYRANGSFHDVKLPRARMVYVTADGHNHWHLQRVATYSLWNHAKTRRVAVAKKIGFCLEDSLHADPGIGPSAAVYNDAHGRAFCQAHHPDALSVFEGISPGWRDLYLRTFAFQWVNVEKVQPGVYWLREDVDPLRQFIAHKSPRPFAYDQTPTVIPGYDSKPIDFGPVAPGASVTVGLLASHFGSPGPLQFRVDTPPAHGTLNVKTGSWMSSPTVTYHRDAGYHGPDSFTYAARDSASQFPFDPADATVSLGVGAGQIKALLKKEITPVGKSATIRSSLRHHGYLRSVRALVPGHLVISWFGLSGGKRVLVASGQGDYSSAGTIRIRFVLTPAGRKVLGHRGTAALLAKGSFTPATKPPVRASRGFGL